MRNLIVCLFLILSSFCFSQKFEKFTDAENHLILFDAQKELVVIQKSNPSDSIILKTNSKIIDPADLKTKILSEKMLVAVLRDQGVGIAAPQVGINRRMILVQRFDKPGNPFDVMINPEILWHSELMQKGPEGDLSFEERGLVMRYYAVQIQYFNLKGEEITEFLEGFTSVIFQHERDHLDGILLTDRVEEQKSLTFKPANENTNLYFLGN
ncbi:MAG TPA: peptide deformylase [Moheibacter sp.]|nr:peptide deformylase [Moheibacter sp.]